LDGYGVSDDGTVWRFGGGAAARGVRRRDGHALRIFGRQSRCGQAQVATLKTGGTSEEEVIKSLGKPNSSTPSADGGKTDEYDFTQALSSSSSPACPMKTQKVTFIFDSRNILQSMQINF
jgi:hypothetical protein